eukprot:CAMPEP_0196658648 /NCGR_PEP_ID=MMETSP1086-20130531/30740_1 /TAXON_ID=77921 /ORGANISM="Cyanoptyche  gloeocystis , Strain SAG4.97" /LENGTH=147 /DNA_ID=CAMNT_0041992305 /DNA_START=148 /DNA_END=591 /DNA_ORIENTATION=+
MPKHHEPHEGQHKHSKKDEMTNIKATGKGHLHERHSGDGRPIKHTDAMRDVRKGGAGGNGAWGKIGEEMEDLDMEAVERGEGLETGVVSQSKVRVQAAEELVEQQEEDLDEFGPFTSAGTHAAPSVQPGEFSQDTMSTKQQASQGSA